MISIKNSAVPVRYFFIQCPDIVNGKFRSGFGCVLNAPEKGTMVRCEGRREYGYTENTTDYH